MDKYIKNRITYNGIGSTDDDMTLLFECMENFGNGDFSYVNREDFDEPQIGDMFNRMLKLSLDRNNKYLARINDAQYRIGDSTCLKNMLALISTQQEIAEVLSQYRESADDGEFSTDDVNREFLMLSKEIKNTFLPCIKEVRKSMFLLDGMLNGGEMDASEEIRKRLSVVSENLYSMTDRISDMSEDAEKLYEVLDKNSRFNETFLESVDSIVKSYKELSSECLDTGRYLIRISRDVDNARNDMFRHNSKPTLHDELRVYDVDHLTLTWRLYNNIVEFESLRLTQVNNPESCKFGKWVQKSKDSDAGYVSTDEFNAVVEAHLALHEISVKCFEAKQQYDNALAMKYFEEALKNYEAFHTALEALHERLRELGITEETDVWKFRG